MGTFDITVTPEFIRVIPSDDIDARMIVTDFGNSVAMSLGGGRSVTGLVMTSELDINVVDALTSWLMDWMQRRMATSGTAADEIKNAQAE